MGFLKLAASLLLMPMLSACAEERMTPYYAKSDVQPVVVERVDDDRIAMRFHVPPESMYFASGVNYEVDGASLRVVIDRCGIQGNCDTMVKRATPLAESRIAEVLVPFRGRRVTVVYSDQEDSLDL